MVNRIVSLAPSATATIEALGAGDRIVETVTPDPDPDGIGGWLTPALDRVAAADPSLVVTTDALQEPIAAELVEAGHDVAHFDPRTLAEAIAYIEDVAAAIDEGQTGRELAQSVRSRLDRIEANPSPSPAPVVYCEEWSDPPMAAGNWVPEAVSLCGGRYPFRDPGERSGRVDRTTVEAAAPQYAFLHICGADTDVDPTRLADRGWELPAIDDGNVHVVPDDLLNQPGIRLIDGIERLATHLSSGSMDG